MAKILDGPEGILDVASWLGGGTYMVMCALKGEAMRDALVLNVRVGEDPEEFDRKLLRVAAVAAKELTCSPDDIEFVVSYMGKE